MKKYNYKAGIFILFILLSIKASSEELNIVNSEKIIKETVWNTKEYEKIDINNGIFKYAGNKNGLKTKELKMENNAAVDITLITNSEKNKYAFSIVGGNKEIGNKNSNIKIRSFSTGEIKEAYGSYHAGMDRAIEERNIGLKFGIGEYKLNGIYDIKATAIGIDSNNSPELIFGENTHFNIFGGAAGIYSGGNKLVFENGSSGVIKSGSNAILARPGGIANVIFKPNTKVTMYGNIGINAKKGDWVKFENEGQKIPEIKIYSNEAAINNANVDGKVKLHAIAHDIIHSGGSSGTLILVDGSVLEGNIAESKDTKIIMEKGSKIFADGDITANFQSSGDIYAGSRYDYEKIDGKAGASMVKNYKVIEAAIKLKKEKPEIAKKLFNKVIGNDGRSENEIGAKADNYSDAEVENIFKEAPYLSELDAIAGASYTLLNDKESKDEELKKYSLKKSKKAILAEIGLVLGRELNPKHSYHIEKVAQDGVYSILNLKDGKYKINDATIHLKAGEKRNIWNPEDPYNLFEDIKEAQNDKIVFETGQEINAKGTKVLIHPVGENNVRKGDVFDIIVEKKGLGKYGEEIKYSLFDENTNRSVFNIPAQEIGAYVFKEKITSKGDIKIHTDIKNDDEITKEYLNKFSKEYKEKYTPESITNEAAKEILAQNGLVVIDNSKEFYYTERGNFVNLDFNSEKDKEQFKGNAKNNEIRNRINRKVYPKWDEIEENFNKLSSGIPTEEVYVKGKIGEEIEKYNNDPEIKRKKQENEEAKGKSNELVISLVTDGELSYAAKENIRASVDFYKDGVSLISDFYNNLDNRLYSSKNKKSFWVDNSKRIIQRKNSKDIKKINNLSVGYNHSLLNDIDFGIILGKNNSKDNSINLAAYITKYNKNKKGLKLTGLMGYTNSKGAFNSKNQFIGLEASYLHNLKDRVYIQPSINTTIIHRDKFKEIGEKFNTKISGDTYLYSKANVKLIYDFDNISSYLEYGLGTTLFDNYHVIINDEVKVNKRANLSEQNIGFGFNWHITPNSAINLNIKRDISNKYKTNMNYGIGYQYIF